MPFLSHQTHLHFTREYGCVRIWWCQEQHRQNNEIKYKMSQIKDSQGGGEKKMEALASSWVVNWMLENAWKGLDLWSLCWDSKTAMKRKSVFFCEMAIFFTFLLFEPLLVIVLIMPSSHWGEGRCGKESYPRIWRKKEGVGRNPTLGYEDGWTYNSQLWTDEINSN